MLATFPRLQARLTESLARDVDVSILSVCNCIGRLACGVVGDWALTRHGIPRPAVFGWFIWMMALAMGLLAIGTIPGKAPPYQDRLCDCRSERDLSTLTTHTMPCRSAVCGHDSRRSVLWGFER